VGPPILVNRRFPDGLAPGDNGLGTSLHGDLADDAITAVFISGEGPYTADTAATGGFAGRVYSTTLPSP
jgi:hypothetical protein